MSRTLSTRIAVVAVALAALAGCSSSPGPVVDAPPTPAPTTSAPATTAPATSAPASAVAVPSVQPAGNSKLFLVAMGDDGRNGEKLGCSDSLVAVDAGLPPSAAPLRPVVDALLAAPGLRPGVPELTNTLANSTLTADSVTVKDGTAVLALKGDLRIGGICDAPRVQRQLEATALQFPTVKKVDISVNGRPLRDVLSQS